MSASLTLPITRMIFLATRMLLTSSERKAYTLVMLPLTLHFGSASTQCQIYSEGIVNTRQTVPVPPLPIFLTKAALLARPSLYGAKRSVGKIIELSGSDVASFKRLF